MVNQRIALFSTSAKVSFSQVQDIANAIHVQLIRDYEPIWERPTSIVAVKDAKSAPLGSWLAQILNDLGQPGALGYHSDPKNQPMAFISTEDDVGVTTSHEVLEMATDPFGNRLIVAPSMEPGISGDERYLCEVGDPFEAETYAINGVNVSNFIKPEFFDRAASPGMKYDFLGNHDQPMVIAQGGYISWLDAEGEWQQQTWFDGDAPSFTGRLGAQHQPGQSLREFIDAHVRVRRALK